MSILIKPVITEKMTGITDKLGSYGFIVEKTANKIQIANAVEAMYGVKVDSVNTMRYFGKVKMRMTKTGSSVGRTNNYKKAIVTLVKGESIDFYSTI